jgi:4-hydroxybenzoate polyprenyltransferase
LKAISYLRLTRPANVVTSVADVLAGIAIAGVFSNDFLSYLQSILLLCLSTAFLYAGGIVFNDVFDAELDKIERPERAIPSGLISIKNAAILGSLLLFFGIGMASLSSITSGGFALGIAFFALLYNKWGKHHYFFGPFSMGICRGLNLLLGISIITAAIGTWYFLAIVPIIYIFSITMISRGEVHGGNKTNLYFAVVLYAIVIGCIALCSFKYDRLLLALLFLMPFAWMIFKPLFKAIQQPIGKNIGKAVKAGVLSLIIMDAAWAATFSSVYAAIIITCLLPVSLWLAKIFAVT